MCIRDSLTNEIKDETVKNYYKKNFFQKKIFLFFSDKNKLYIMMKSSNNFSLNIPLSLDWWYSFINSLFFMPWSTKVVEIVFTKDLSFICLTTSERFFGIAPELHEGLRSGSIPRSVNFPYAHVFDKKTGKYRSQKELKNMFLKYSGGLYSGDLVAQ